MDSETEDPSRRPDLCWKGAGPKLGIVFVLGELEQLLNLHLTFFCGSVACLRFLPFGVGEIYATE